MNAPNGRARAQRAAPASPTAERKTTKAQARRDALGRWWARGPWPCVILAVDPGKMAGASVIVSRPGGLTLKSCIEVQTYKNRILETVVDRAVELSYSTGLPLVGVLEDWGAGGPRGMAQWFGLAETRGCWRREILLRGDGAKVVLAPMARWRSRVIEKTGATDERGDWRRFEPEEWKVAALEAAREYFISGHVPPGPDTAESACLGIYAARSDEVGKVLKKKHLRAHGLRFEVLEPLIRGK